MTRRGLCAAMLLLGAAAVPAASFAATTPPAAQLRGETLSVTLPGALLSEGEVRKRLHSGLTTTFVIVATLDDERTGGARVDVRFEPWDEVYFVTLRRIGAQPQQQRAASFAQLETWWRETSLPLFTGAGGVKRVQVAVDVIPFSAEEQEETQRWLTRSLGEARQPSPPPPTTTAQGPNPRASASSSVLDVLIGTSIQRRPIFRRRWQLQVTR